MIIIDTHAHIYVDDFDADGKEQISAAVASGVSQILMPAIDSQTHEKLLHYEKEFPAVCRAMMGVHPCSINETYETELRLAEEMLQARSFLAVGEIGLDFYWDLTFKEQQYQALHRQLEWALHYDIPVSIHSRNATDECLEVVASHQKGRLKGVFHCFSGSADQAGRAIDLGFHLGIGGVLTFKNSGLDQSIKGIDPKHFVLETDAPYLAPVPFRGKRNTPVYLPHVLQKLADIKQMPLEEMARITTANAQKLFGL